MDNARHDFDSIMKKVKSLGYDLAGYNYALEQAEEDLRLAPFYNKDEVKQRRDNYKQMVERVEKRREELLIEAATIKKNQPDEGS